MGSENKKRMKKNHLNSVIGSCKANTISVLLMVSFKRWAEKNYQLLPIILQHSNDKLVKCRKYHQRTSIMLKIA
ncbi:hypothetical protein CH381_27365 [Leptospira sp. mixed culture ATI2-C-A1]|nr:hypothetical protein CH381_27365 [Leptospira sp. mixed culture ATI2-C-A1]